MLLHLKHLGQKKRNKRKSINYDAASDEESQITMHILWKFKNSSQISIEFRKILVLQL